MSNIGVPIKKIAAGFSTDMNMLLDRFVAGNTVRYEGFAKLWREAKFSLIFCGRKDQRELRQFIDEAFHIILQLWVPTSNFQERVFALYMLYGMYTMQPVTPKIKIRIRPNHWDLSEELLRQSDKEQHLDICYVLHRMRVERSFHFVAFLKLRSPALLTEREDDRSSISELTMKVFSNLRDITKGGLLEQLSLLHDQYAAMKSMQDDPSVSELDMVRENIFESFGREILKIQTKYRVQAQQDEGGTSSDPDEDSDVVSDTSDVGTRRKRLRQRQFARTSQTRKGQRYEELATADDSGDHSSHDAAPKQKQQRSKKSTRAKAKASTAEADKEKTASTSNRQSKAGKSKGRQTKSTKTSASKNVSQHTEGNATTSLIEVAAAVKAKVQENAKAYRKPGRKRPKKSDKPSAAEPGEGADREKVSKKRGRKSGSGPQSRAKKAKKS